MVFIHGLSDSLLYWEFLAGKLKNDYQILRIDLRGHGQSELGNEEITTDTYVNDLKDLLDELGISNVNLVGFSLGGTVALDFTLKYPQMVDSLVLMCSFHKATDGLKDTLSQFRDALNVGFDEFYDLILPMTLCPDVIEENKMEMEILKEMASQNANVEAYIKANDTCFEFNVEENLSEIDIPVLILSSKFDDIATSDIEEDLHRKIEGSELIVLDNVKHNLLVGENNGKILAILKEFF